MFTKLKKQTLVITYGTLPLNSVILTLSLSFQKLLIYLTKVICCVCVCVCLSLSLFKGLKVCHNVVGSWWGKWSLCIAQKLKGLWAVCLKSLRCVLFFSFVLGFGSHVKVELRSILSLTWLGTLRECIRHKE
jgi:hypothetical protein